MRTFAPFVAGIGHMTYTTFMSYSAIGGLFWINFFVFGGYFFGNVPIVKDNLSFFILGIVFISIIPAIIQFVRIWFERSRKNKSQS
jgi:membrane-associated protein